MNGEIDKDTYANLITAAQNQNEAYFEFDPKTFLKNAKLIEIPLGEGIAYDHVMQCGFCYSVQDHTQPIYHKTLCIIDVMGDAEGTVNIYSLEGNKIKTTTTKYEDNHRAVKEAYKLAFYAYNSWKYNPGPDRGNGDSYKAMLRYYSLNNYWMKFKELGVPSILLPHGSNPTKTEERERKEGLAEDTINQVLTGQTSDSYRARFVLQNGKLGSSSASGTGQNRGIFGAKKTETTPELIIEKVDAKTGKVLKGGKYQIWELDKNGNRKEMVYSGKTNASGELHCRQIVKEGTTYEVEETAAPAGYILATETKKIKIKKGTNKVRFKNTKDDEDNYSFMLDKIDADTKEGCEGAEFGVFRYEEYDNGEYEKTSGSYVQANNPNSNYFYPSDSYVPQYYGGGVYLQGSNGTYWYSPDYYSRVTDRSLWKNSSGSEYKFDNNATASTAGAPYVQVTIYIYQRVPRKEDEDKEDNEEEKDSKPKSPWEMNDSETQYVLELTSTISKLIQIKSENRGNNYWKKHYRTSFFSKSSQTFEKIPINSMKSSSKYHLVTDENGEIYIGSDLKENYNYYAMELKTPPGSYELYNNGNPFSCGKISSDNKKVTVEVTNIWTRGELLLKKINSDQPNVVLNGVEFKFKNTDLNRWVVKNGQKISFSEKETDATIFTTGIDGKTPNDGCIYIDNLRSGNYQYYEVSVSKNFGVENNGQGVVVVPANGSGSVTVKNIPLYIDISGEIWVDGRTFKNGSRDNLCDPINKGINGEDKRLSEEQLQKTSVRFVVMRPDEQTGKKVLDETRSEYIEVDKNGYWKIEGVEIGLINHEDCSNIDAYGNIDFSDWDYYFEYTYDGFTYQAVTPYDEIPQDIITAIKSPQYNGLSSGIDQWFETIINQKGSKAREDNNLRTELNNKFATVEGVPNSNDTVQAKDSNGNATSTVKYTLSDGVASIKDATNVTVMAKTDTNSLWYNRKQDTSYEIKYINLGLYKRAQIDTALMQGVQEVDVGIKGDHHIYEYNLEGKALKADEDEANAINAGKEEWEHQEPKIWDNVGVTFAERFKENNKVKKYKQPIYRADFIYKNDNDKSKELEIILTYKITLRNQTGLTIKINSITDYFDKRYQLYKIGTNLQNHQITNEIAQDKIIRYGEVEKTNKIGIDLKDQNIELDAYSNKELYIQFKFDKVAVLAALNQPGDVEGYQDLKNIAEISSYTTYEDGKLYAAADKDSVLDNAIIDNENTYEDDTRKALGIGLVLKEPREITGYVFEDENDPDKLANENIRQGNGICDGEESGIEGVKVELLEKIENPSNPENPTYTSVISEDGRTPEITCMTDENGKYTLTGFTPGNYIIRFNWGGAYKVKDKDGKELTPIDYKATIYDKDRYDVDNGNTDYYKRKNVDNQAVKTYYENLSNSGVDITALTYALDDWSIRENIDRLLNIKDSEGNVGDYNFASKDNGVYNLDNIKNIIMKSNTPVMKFKIEYDDYDLSTINVKENVNEETTSVKFTTPGINFGIIERPRQDISIEKYIKNIKLKYSSGETVVNADVDMKGNLTGQTDYTSYIGKYTDSRNRRNSLIRIEADAEILQNSSMEAIYEYIIRNESERDYYNKEFYNFGIIPEGERGLVKITASKIMDYLSNNCIAKVKDTSTINNNNEWILKTIEEVKSRELVDCNRDMFMNPVKDKTMYLTEYGNSEEKAVAPKKSNKQPETIIEMEVEKRLSSNYDDKTDISNQAEIIAIKKDFGRRIINSIPGNFVPNKAGQEIDDAMSENITIISSTGANRNYAIYITISIIILTTIAGGIFYIKRKIENNMK